MSTIDEAIGCKKQCLGNNHNNSKDVNGTTASGDAGNVDGSGTRDKVALITGITGQVGGNQIVQTQFTH